MPIIGLTDQAPRPVRLGAVKLGAPKQEGKAPSNLDYFRFDPHSGFEYLTDIFTDVYGDSPGSLHNVRFLWPDIESNWQAWIKVFDGAKREIMRTDGETIVSEYDYDTGHYISSNRPFVPAEWVDKKGNPRYAYSSSLEFVLEDLCNAAGQFGTVVMYTKSVYNIEHINSQLQIAYHLYGGLNRFYSVLSRWQREITVDMNGNKSKQRKWLVNLNFTMPRALPLTEPNAPALPQGDFEEPQAGEPEHSAPHPPVQLRSISDYIAYLELSDADVITACHAVNPGVVLFPEDWNKEKDGSPLPALVAFAGDYASTFIDDICVDLFSDDGLRSQIATAAKAIAETHLQSAASESVSVPQDG